MEKDIIKCLEKNMSFQMTYFSKYSKKISVVINKATVIISDID